MPLFNEDDFPDFSSSLSISPPSQSLVPDTWFGWDEIVLALAAIIVGNENHKIAILGAGRMGNDATALHLIRNEAVFARYSDRAFFIVCDTATSADILASCILQTINVSADPW